MFGYAMWQWALEHQRLARERAYNDGYVMTRHYRYGDDISKLRVVIGVESLNDPYVAGKRDALRKITELQHRRA